MLDKNALLAQLDTLDAYYWQERCRGWRTHETCGESVYWVFMAVVDSSQASKLTLEELAEHIKKLPPMFLKSSKDQSQHWESQAYEPPEDDPNYDFAKVIREIRANRSRQPDTKNGENE